MYILLNESTLTNPNAYNNMYQLQSRPLKKNLHYGTKSDPLYHAFAYVVVSFLNI